MRTKSPIALEAVGSALADLWSPRVLARVNDHLLKVARVQGEFPWHAHADEDELFLVLRGELQIGRSAEDGGPVVVRAGECFVVPRGVRHNTSAAEETVLALLEPASTLHAGGEVTPMARSLAEQMRER